jgi:simple sugar transport system ATP-binding protein
MTGIVKRFDGVAANDRIDFTIRPGEIHALVGENGAGKSTLMNVLAGVYKPDAGEIRLFDRPVRFRSPRDAIRAGVGMVHQHFAQIPSCTVAQNMALADPDAPFFFDRRRIGEKIRELGERTGIRLDPDALVERLSIGEQQRLELLRLLANDARVLILDEPTAALTPGEADELFALLQALAKRGRAIVFITHKLDEVEACAERVTVLSCGRAVATDVPLTQCCREEIVGWMVGQAEPAAAERAARAPGAVVLELAGVAAEPAGAGAALRDVKLAVRAGEIVAIAGVAGNGQRELAETIVGLRPLASGRRLIGGEDASDWPPWRIRCAGVGFVPEDRLGCGVCPNLSLAENLNLASFGPGASFFPDGERLRCRAADRAAAWKIGRQDLGAPVRFLSGGNVQRAILAREIAAGEKLLLAAQPTRGLDIGAVAAVRAALLARRNAGVAVLLISYDLDEIFEVADRIAVMARGRLVAEFSRPFPDRAVIGMAMLGGPARAH